MIGGCRVVDGDSALLLPLPLRYAAVVPAQNASGCVMLREGETFSMRTKASWSTSITETKRMRSSTGDNQQQQHFL